MVNNVMNDVKILPTRGFVGGEGGHSWLKLRALSSLLSRDCSPGTRDIFLKIRKNTRRGPILLVLPR